MAKYAAVASLLVALAGCSGSSGFGQHSLPPAPNGIRGTELPSFSCHVSADGTAVRVASTSVVEIDVCPITAPAPFNRPNRVIVLLPGNPKLASLVSALSLPDIAATPNTACPLYAELEPAVVAKTTSASLLVHLPADGCGHPLPAVNAALSAVTT